MDNVALITGSTRGIGRATAVRFAREGAKVVVTGRTESAGREVEREIRDAGGDAIYVRTDLAEEDDVIAAVRAAVDNYGKLTTLVNNAAPTELMGPGRLDRRVTELTNEGWNSIMLVALKAVVWTCKYSIPEMVTAGGGAIVNISSAASMLGTPGLDTYTAAKGALNTLTRSMAVEYAADGLRVNCIVAGMVLTSEGAFKMMEDPVIGGVAVAFPLAASFPSKATKTEHLVEALRSPMSRRQLDQYVVDLKLARQFVPQVDSYLPDTATQLNLSRTQLDQLLATESPALAKAIPDLPGFLDVANLLIGQKLPADVPYFQDAKDLPRSTLTWLLIGSGGVVTIIAAMALVVDRRKKLPA